MPAEQHSQLGRDSSAEGSAPLSHMARLRVSVAAWRARVGRGMLAGVERRRATVASARSEGAVESDDRDVLIRGPLTIAHSMHLVNRVRAVSRGSRVWKPDVGAIRPEMVQRFAASVAGRTRSVRSISVRRPPRPVELEGSEELTLPGAPAWSAAASGERDRTVQIKGPSVFSVGQRIEPFRKSPPSVPQSGSGGPPRRSGQVRPPRQVAAGSRVFARVQEMPSHSSGAEERAPEVGSLPQERPTGGQAESSDMGRTPSVDDVAGSPRPRPSLRSPAAREPATSSIPGPSVTGDAQMPAVHAQVQRDVTKARPEDEPGGGEQRPPGEGRSARSPALSDRQIAASVDEASDQPGSGSHSGTDDLVGQYDGPVEPDLAVASDRWGQSGPGESDVASPESETGELPLRRDVRGTGSMPVGRRVHDTDVRSGALGSRSSDAAEPASGGIHRAARESVSADGPHSSSVQDQPASGALTPPPQGGQEAPALRPTTEPVERQGERAETESVERYGERAETRPVQRQSAPSFGREGPDPDDASGAPSGFADNQAGPPHEVQVRLDTPEQTRSTSMTDDLPVAPAPRAPVQRRTQETRSGEGPRAAADGVDGRATRQGYSSVLAREEALTTPAIDGIQRSRREAGTDPVDGAYTSSSDAERRPSGELTPPSRIDDQTGQSTSADRGLSEWAGTDVELPLHRGARDGEVVGPRHTPLSESRPKTVSHVDPFEGGVSRAEKVVQGRVTVEEEPASEPMDHPRGAVETTKRLETPLGAPELDGDEPEAAGERTPGIEPTWSEATQRRGQIGLLSAGDVGRRSPLIVAPHVLPVVRHGQMLRIQRSATSPGSATSGSSARHRRSDPKIGVRRAIAEPGTQGQGATQWPRTGAQAGVLGERDDAVNDSAGFGVGARRFPTAGGMGMGASSDRQPDDDPALRALLASWAGRGTGAPPEMPLSSSGEVRRFEDGTGAVSPPLAAPDAAMPLAARAAPMDRPSVDRQPQADPSGVGGPFRPIASGEAAPPVDVTGGSKDGQRGSPAVDVKTLAQRVYPYVRRLIAIERERGPYR
ncbi:MAG: hypothetical protein GX620_09195 [Chloroflexi bacterium]|nr:hypothetical protein [Chloroflexota bacterium]